MPDSAPGGELTALICRDLQIQHRDREADHAPSSPDRETLIPRELTVPVHNTPGAAISKFISPGPALPTMSVQLPPATHRKRTVPQSELEAASTLKLGADQNTHTLSLSEARLVIHKVLENKRRGGTKYEEPE